MLEDAPLKTKDAPRKAFNGAAAVTTALPANIPMVVELDQKAPGLQHEPMMLRFEPLVVCFDASAKEKGCVAMALSGVAVDSALEVISVMHGNPLRALNVSAGMFARVAWTTSHEVVGAVH